MEPTIQHLEKIIANYTRRLEAISEDAYNAKPGPGKWSKKEMLGHLVDSAQNNIRRFIVAQYEETPVILYNQDKWVDLTGYQRYPTRDLLTLWILLNRHICRVLRSMPAGAANRKCFMGNSQPHTLEWVAADYCNHLLHHLHRILDLDPIAYP
ncbi:MAG: DinB family protein [Bacteroidetes bacterium]|nr:DinB family protein [Bacteroidota bacterium]